MSSISLRSKSPSVRSLTHRRRKKHEKRTTLKPFGFCCSEFDFDPLTEYDQRNFRFKSSLFAITSVHESPVLKVRTELSTVPYRKQISKLKFSSYEESENNETSLKNNTLTHNLAPKPTRYIEHEIALAKKIFWEERRKVYEEQSAKNVVIGKKNVDAKIHRIINLKVPRWYQDFSLDQMKNLMVLETVIQDDYKEMVTGRTQKTLMAIGVISTFFKLPPETIRKLQRASNFKAVDFLREVYKILTGDYFEYEGYKKSYDCNERIILSAIAFLTLPETVRELHKRLPPVVMPKFIQKPVPPICPPRRKGSSPYTDELFVRPDWASYLNSLQQWREYCKSVKIPKLIFLSKENLTADHEKAARTRIGKRYDLRHTSQSATSQETRMQKAIATEKSRKKEDNVITIVSSDVFRSPSESKKFDFTFTGLSEKPGPVEYKIYGTLKTPKDLPKYTKSWLGEKSPHYVIEGASEDPPSCPVKYEMTGVANVTPSNSDEKFFAVLKLGDGPKKIYPSGRENLSRKWQEWLQNADEEFRQVQNQANKIMKSIEATTKLVFPGPTCDSCCACRQTRKSHIKWRETKAPYMVIDTMMEDEKKNRYIVGSMAMHSPAPSPAESTVNLLEVVSSEDKLVTNIVINGVKNEQGETQYYITGIKKDTVHVPSRVVEPPPPLPLRNVPPCACAVHQVFNKGVNPTLSNDNIPWTKNEGLCFGKKYRPDETGAFSCRMHPGDKSCRRNPFMKDIVKMKRKREEEERKSREGKREKKERRMYSIADFQPCGDTHGMSVCGAPWGTSHILSPEELAEQERVRKEILKAPPCGTKPGRAICGGPWGAKVPEEKKRAKYKDEEEEEEKGGEGEEEVEEEEEEEEEEKEEEEKKEEKPTEVVKPKRRDKRCHMSPESIAARKKPVVKKESRFIPDPSYHGYDDPWNIFRTAPSKKEVETDYQKSLKLSTPQPRTSIPVSIKLVRKGKGEVKVKRQKSETRKTKDVARLRSSQKVKSESVTKLDKFKKTGKQNESALKLRDRKRKVSHKETSVERKRKLQHSKIETGTRKGNRKAKDKQKTNKDIAKSPSLIKHKKTKPKVTAHSKPERKSRKRFESFGIKQHRQETPRRIQSDKLGSLQETKSKKRKARFSEIKQGKPDRKKDIQLLSDPIDKRKKEMQKLKDMMKSPSTYPYEVAPVSLPEAPSIPCKRESEDKSPDLAESLPEENVTAQISEKGPCGWKTKSEQELPTKKNLVYLTEKDHPLETIPLREGGRPCVCRQNREKKKILLFNIAGLASKKKDVTKRVGSPFKKKKEEEEEQDKMQVIDGVIYYTPPPSPKRSEEYVVEYDLYDSPYDKCTSQRKDDTLKLIEQHSGPKNLVSRVLKTSAPCKCDDYLNTFGVADEKRDVEELEKKKREFLESKPPEERWALALKDVGLTEYFTHCKDSLPCWLRCARFSKEGCGPRQRKLTLKKPVCECKYERKILERREEKLKWKERQQRLKSYKKRPFVNITDTSRPIELDTKLLISGVKRIPREDEYVDDITYCITGVAENYSMSPPKQVVAGLSMSTPLHTPEPSKQNISSAALHRHWSPTKIPPGPLPRKDQPLIDDMVRRQKALDDAYKQIYGSDDKQKSNACHRICEEICDPQKISKGKRMRKRKDQNQQMESDATLKRKALKEERRQIIDHKVRQQTKKERGQDTVQMREYPWRDDKIETNEDEDSISSRKIDLKSAVKNELTKMAQEGFLFAKLPKSFLVPQLQDWIMYRKGIAFSDTDKKRLMRATVATWNLMNVIKPPTIKVPSLHILKDDLTYKNAHKIKHQIETKKAVYYSQVRKARVVFARSLWTTMEFGKFPSLSFKKAYFTYMASKESDGHVFRPWFPLEIRETQK